jgi:hypothetical protein
MGQLSRNDGLMATPDSDDLPLSDPASRSWPLFIYTHGFEYLRDGYAAAVVMLAVTAMKGHPSERRSGCPVVPAGRCGR